MLCLDQLDQSACSHEYLHDLCTSYYVCILTAAWDGTSARVLVILLTGIASSVLRRCGETGTAQMLCS
jgi:hypothetical protein